MKKYKSKYKKAVNGLQNVSVPEQGSDSNVLSSTTSMAMAGSQFGPWGAAAGGALGLATGLIQKDKQDKANREATNRNTFLTANRAVAGIDEGVDQKEQVYKKGTKMIEIEGKKTPEIHTDKNFNIKNLGTTPHSKGGNKVVASEGDIVFNTQDSTAKYNKIVGAIKKGDKQTLIKEKNKLPEDSGNKNQDGNKGVKSRTFHYNSYGDKVYDEVVDNTPKYKVRNKLSTAPKRPINRAAALVGGIDNVLSNTFSRMRKASAIKDVKPQSAPINKAAYAPTPIKPTTSISNFVTTKGTKTPVTAPKSATKPKGVATAGRKINTNTPIIANPAKSINTNYLNDKADRGNATDLDTATKPFEFAASNVPDPLNPSAKTGNTSTGNITQAPNKMDANNLIQYAGVANNLFQGMKSESPTEEKYFDPQLNKYVDRSQSLRQASVAATNIQTANARNVSGGNATNLRANQNQAAMGNLTRQDAINEQEMARRDALEVANTGLKNSAAQYNIQRRDMYQGQSDASAAAKTAYMDQAAQDIGKIGNARQEEKYLRDKDDKANAVQLAGLKRIGTKNFTTDENGNVVTRGLDNSPAITPTSTFPTASTTPTFSPQTLFTGKLGKAVSKVFKSKKR